MRLAIGAATVAVEGAFDQRGRLSAAELRYCLGRSRPDQRIAGRLAAHAAFRHAVERLGCDVDPGDVEIVAVAPRFGAGLGWGPAWMPVCRPIGGRTAPPFEVSISIAHDAGTAVAAALLTTGAIS